MAVDAPRERVAQLILEIAHPRPEAPVVEEQLVARRALVEVVVRDRDVVRAARDAQRRLHRGGRRVVERLHDLQARGRLEGVHARHAVPAQRHGLGLDAPRVVAHAARGVGDAGEGVVELRDGVAPDDGVAGLVLEAEEHLVEPLLVDEAGEGAPARGEGGGGGGAGVVRVVEVLDHRLAGLQHVRVGHVVEPEEEVVGGGRDLLVLGGDGGGVLACVAGAVPDGAVHADAGGVGACPLAPGVVVHCGIRG